MALSVDAPIFLIGYRGTGKTSVARELADRLAYHWVDADDLVEQLTGKTIAAIFADEGETGFREWEARVVATLCRKRRTVVALGGGAVLREDNREAIYAAGPVVWLTASVDTILERTTADSTTASRRPNLTIAGGRAEIESLLATRMPFYRQCATLVVDTEEKTSAEVAGEIAANL
jgi:shikimate kinase